MTDSRLMIRGKQKRRVCKGRRTRRLTIPWCTSNNWLLMDLVFDRGDERQLCEVYIVV